MDLTVRPFDDALVSLLLTQGLLYGYSRDTVLLGLGEVSYSEKVDRAHAVFFAPDYFFDQRACWIMPQYFLHVTKASVIEALERVAELSPTVEPLVWEAPDAHGFRRRFIQVQREIRAGRWEKAVPVSFERARGPLLAPHLLQMLTGVLSAPEPLIPFGMWNSQTGIIGASPELMAAVSEHRNVRACALAGTATKAEGAERLMTDPKEQHEHQLVVTFLNEHLATLGEPHVGKTSIQELPHLFHLFTPVQVTASKEVDLLTLAHLLHPSPALGVTPRHLGWTWLRDMDRESPRGRFGAPFGVQLGNGESLACISIRAIQWESNQGDEGRIQLGAGCGVVAQSDLEREWAELAAKRESVHRLLGI